MTDEKKPGFFKRIASGIKRFFKDTKSELKKVVWPSKKTCLLYTSQVVGCNVPADVMDRNQRLARSQRHPFGIV